MQSLIDGDYMQRRTIVVCPHHRRRDNIFSIPHMITAGSHKFQFAIGTGLLGRFHFTKLVLPSPTFHRKIINMVFISLRQLIR